jgi:hypothetical protein
MGVTVTNYEWRGITIPSCYINIRDMLCTKGRHAYEYQYNMYIYIGNERNSPLHVQNVRFTSTSVDVANIWHLCYANMKATLPSTFVNDTNTASFPSAPTPPPSRSVPQTQ